MMVSCDECGKKVYHHNIYTMLSFSTSGKSIYVHLCGKCCHDDNVFDKFNIIFVFIP